jgi:UDP-galactopyranose mutase
MDMQTPAPIVAFSNLRWESLPARSQRVLSKLAKTRSVFFLEEPEQVETGDREFWELKCGAPDVLVCRPRIAADADPEPATCARMAQALLRWLDIDEFVAWLYSPVDTAWAQALSPALVVHDKSVDTDAFEQAFLPASDEAFFEVSTSDFFRREFDEGASAED